MKIILAGGGSGGHFYPLIAVTESVRDVIRERKLLQAKIYYLAPTPYNAGLLFDHEIEFQRVNAGKIRRYFSLRNIFDIILTGIGFVEAFIKVFIIFPDVIFSKGGFMSLPVVFAGKLFGIPIILHESDSAPGRANVWAGKFAKRIALSYAEAAPYFGKENQEKIVWTGNPVRKEILEPITEGAKEYLKLEENIPTILILGGSLGAKKINDTVLDTLKTLVPNYQIIHQTGKLNFKETSNTAKVVLENDEHQDRYHSFDYLSALAMRMSAGVSDLIISRGGSQIFEISAWGIPSIIIPIKDSNGDHQRKNAFNYARFGGAVVIEENNLTPEILISEIKHILEDKGKLEKMKKGALAFAKTDSAYKIAEQIVDIAVSHEKE